MKKFIKIMLILSVLIMAVCLAVACGNKKGTPSLSSGKTASGTVVVKDSSGATLYNLEEGKEAPNLSWEIPGMGNVYSWYALVDGVQVTVIDNEKLVKNDSNQYLLRTYGVNEVTVYPKEFYTLLTIDGTELKSKAIRGSIPVMLSPLSREYSSFDYFYVKNSAGEQIPITDSNGFFVDIWSFTAATLTAYPHFTSQEFPLNLNYGGEVSSKGNASAVPAKLAYGETFNFSLPLPAKQGYDFEGWYTAETGGTRITDSTGGYSGNVNTLNVLTYNLTDGEITMYAHWSPRLYTVYFYDGDTLITKVDVEYGAKISPLTKAKDNLEFAFWHEQNQGAFDFVNTTMSFANLELYGEWRAHVLAEGNFPCLSGVCTVCGEHVEATAEHTFGAESPVAPTCTDKGYTQKVCTVCGTAEKVAEGEAALGHNFKVAAYTDKTEKCDRCDLETERTLLTIPAGTTAITEKQFENFSSLVSVILPASLKVVDVDAFKGCTSLKAVYFEGSASDWNITVVAGQTEFITASAQNNRFYLVEDAESVPSDGGKYWYKDNNQPVFAHSHSYVEKEVPSTCTETGYKYNLCTVCGETVVVEYIPAEHKPITGAANCRGTYCSVCEEQLVPPTADHTYGTAVIESSATCIQAGDSVETCAKCGYKKHTAIPVIEHIFQKTAEVEATCVSDGYDVEECTMCGITQKSNAGSTPASRAGHTYNRSTVNATPTTLGYYTYICSVCLDSKITYFDYDAVQYVSIATAAELIASRENTNLNYLLTADINLEGAQWTPWGINGTSQKAFKGVFNGNGHKIFNYTITKESVGELAEEDRSVELSLGFFGSVTGKIINLTLGGDINITDANATLINVGGVCGKMDGLISGVSNTGKVSLVANNSGIYAGGIVGILNGIMNASSYNCTPSDSYGVNVYGRTYTYGGGLCGFSSQDSLISNCIASCSVLADSAAADCYAGGALGSNGGKLFRTIASGNVSSEGALKGYAGGIAGINSGSIGLSLAACSVGARGFDQNQTFSGSAVGANNGSLNSVYSRDGLGITAMGNTVTAKAEGEVSQASSVVNSTEWQKNLFNAEAVLWTFSENTLPTLKTGSELVIALHTVYVVKSADDLAALDGGILSYELQDDLKLKNAKLISMDSFYGKFNGNGYSIKNFCFAKNSPYEALFAQNFGTIDNVNLSDYYSEGKDYPEAALPGIAGVNKGTVSETVTTAKSKVNLPIVWQYVLGIGVALVVGLFVVLATAKSEGGSAILWSLALMGGLIANGVCGFLLGAKIITVCVAATSAVAAAFLAYASFSFYDVDTNAKPGGMIACIDALGAIGYLIAALLLI